MIEWEDGSVTGCFVHTNADEAADRLRPIPEGALSFRYCTGARFVAPRTYELVTPFLSQNLEGSLFDNHTEPPEFWMHREPPGFWAR